MIKFTINEDVWVLHYVEPYTPYLIDRTGKHTIGCTDPLTKTVYISRYLDKNLELRVLKHELCHCIMVSYNYINYIQFLVPAYNRIAVEELICNILADHSDFISYLVRKIYYSYNSI